MNNLWINRLKAAFGIVVVFGLTSCGGGSGSSASSTSITVTSPVTASGGQTIINNAVVASFDTQLVNSNTQATVTVADAVIGNGESATPVSKEVTITVDPNAISTSETDAGITLYLPPSAGVATGVTVSGAYSANHEHPICSNVNT